MSTRIEDELRATFNQRADDITQGTIGRVVSVDYQPRTRRFTRPALTALTGGTALAGATGAAIALLGSAAPAFAGWSPTPTAPTPGELQQAMADCQSQLPFKDLPLQLSDTRGPFTFAIYANAQTSNICITGPSFTSVSGVTAPGPVTVPADQLELTTDHATVRDGSAFSFSDGRAGNNVTGATLTLDDGSQVQATVQNGWFVAWWPGSSEVASATLTTTDGTKTQTFRAPGNPCSPKLCTGGQLGTSTGTSTGPGTSTGGTLTGIPGPATGTGKAQIRYGSVNIGGGSISAGATGGHGAVSFSQTQQR
ncbi:MAG: hypothetical protein ACYDHH_07495 [Solirubrobacteraceae bacterium]